MNEPVKNPTQGNDLLTVMANELNVTCPSLILLSKDVSAVKR